MAGEPEYVSYWYNEDLAGRFPERILETDQGSSVAEDIAYSMKAGYAGHELEPLATAVDVIGFRQVIGLMYAHDTLAHTGIVENRVDDVRGRLVELDLLIEKVIESQAANLRHQEQMAAALGLIRVPAWTTKREVEQGDSMGLDVLSAEELGITVEWAHVEDVAGYDHEQVYRLTPAAGEYTKPDGRVRVTLNLQG